MAEEQLKNVQIDAAAEKAAAEDSKNIYNSRKYIQTVGRRKTSVALVRLFNEGTGSITINGKPFENYFPIIEYRQAIQSPLKVAGKLKEVDLLVKVSGGGKRGQSEAIRMGIARALLKTDENLRTSLRAQGFLTRDARRKERKKPGLKKARKSPQWSKR